MCSAMISDVDTRYISIIDVVVRYFPVTEDDVPQEVEAHWSFSIHCRGDGVQMRGCSRNCVGHHMFACTLTVLSNII